MIGAVPKARLAGSEVKTKIGVLEIDEAARAAAGDVRRLSRHVPRALGPASTTLTRDVEHRIFSCRSRRVRRLVVTGSPAGVYDDPAWIEPLKRFLVEVRN